MESTEEVKGPMKQPGNRAPTSPAEAAVDAKYAGTANEAMDLTPTLPHLTGSEACAYVVSGT